MKTHRVGTFLALMILVLGTALCRAAPKPPVPDFTAGGVKDERHDWTLGPTGARGWIWAWKLEPLLPAIHQAIVEPSPSGVMFASGIRLSGLKLLAKHRVKEGIPLCLKTMDIENWGKRSRITGCLKILQSYGAAAREIMPELKQLEQQLLNHREAKGLTPQIELLRQIMADAEAATEMPELRSIELPE
ncbi:MAG: hypothetical protein V3R99_03160 [Thermoguttaceae bacterium]